MRAESPLTSPAATRDAKEEAECEDSAATGELTAAGGHRWLPGSDETRQRICFVHAFRLLFLHSFNGVTETGTPAGEDVPRPQQLLRLNFHYSSCYLCPRIRMQVLPSRRMLLASFRCSVTGAEVQAIVERHNI